MTKPGLQISSFNLGDSLKAKYVCIWVVEGEGEKEHGVRMAFIGTHTAKAGFLNSALLTFWAG